MIPRFPWGSRERCLIEDWPSLSKMVLKVVLTVWMLAAAVWDARYRRIPNLLTLPIMLVAGSFRIYEGRWHFLIAWAALYLLWRSNVVGGGDAKLLMGLFALFLEPQFLLLFAVVGLVARIPFMLRKYWRRRPSELLASASERLRMGQLVPSGEELREHGRSNAWTYCLPGVIYLWLLWI